jgi:hypothetical protein
MTYLGCTLSFSSNADLAKEKLLEIINESISLVDKLPISPGRKCHSLNVSLKSKLSFVLQHCDISLTWIRTTLDTLVTGKIRNWLELPPCATAHFMPLPQRSLGLDVTLPSMLLEQCQARCLLTLIKSRDTTANQLFHLTSDNNRVQIDSSVSVKINISNIHKSQLMSHQSKLDDLNMQGSIISAVRASIPGSAIESWSKHTALITPSIANFARKALIRCLPTRTNLLRWGRSITDGCPSCTAPETENHVLNNCPIAAQQGRYTWRHNAVLKHLLSIFSKSHPK